MLFSFFMAHENTPILIFAPIPHPAAMRLAVDTVHFGILIDANMEVGL